MKQIIIIIAILLMPISATSLQAQENKHAQAMYIYFEIFFFTRASLRKIFNVCGVFDIIPKFGAVARIGLAGFLSDKIAVKFRGKAHGNNGHLDRFIDEIRFRLLVYNAVALKFETTDNGILR